MLVVEIVVETQPGRASLVAEQMDLIRGMGPPVAEGDHQVRALWKVPEGDTMEGLCEVLQALNPEIVRVYPTLVGQEE